MSRPSYNPEYQLVVLGPHHEEMVLRRAAGQRVRDIAQELGVSRWTVQRACNCRAGRERLRELRTMRNQTVCGFNLFNDLQKLRRLSR